MARLQAKDLEELFMMLYDPPETPLKSLEYAALSPWSQKIMVPDRYFTRFTRKRMTPNLETVFMFCKRAVDMLTLLESTGNDILTDDDDIIEFNERELTVDDRAELTNMLKLTLAHIEELLNKEH